MKKQLLREFQELRCNERGCVDLLDEYEKGLRQQGVCIFPAKLQEAEARNGNGRIYPRRVLEREVQKYQQLIENGRAAGTLNHEDSEDIDMGNISHYIKRLWWSGNDVIGIVQCASTPKGQILKNLYDDGLVFGFSSRALGSLKESRDGSIVQEDLELICFDAVYTPSAPAAYVMRESLGSKKEKISQLFESILTRKKIQ